MFVAVPQSPHSINSFFRFIKPLFLLINFNLVACGGASDSTPETDPLDDIKTPESDISSYDVTVNTQDTVLTEGSSTNLVFSLSQVNVSGESIFVYFSLNGSATIAEDYESLGEWVEFPINSQQAILSLNTLDDSNEEPTESFLLSLSQMDLPQHITLSGQNSVEISIRDNDSQKMPYDLSTRAGAQEFYNDEYLGSDFESNDWSGANNLTCNPGNVSQSVKDKTTRRLNYFRTLVGVPNIEHENNLNSQAQKGAYVAQLQFDEGTILTSQFHVPFDSDGNLLNWDCLDNNAANAMGHSSIAQVGSSMSAANTVDLFVWDPGPNNSSAGHRDNLFRQDLKAIGVGIAQQSVLIMTENNGNPTGMWTWPPALYVPNAILYSWGGNFPRWSIRNEKAFLKWKNKEVNGAITPDISVTDCDGNNLTIQNIKMADNKLLTWEVDVDTSAINDECRYAVNISDYYVVAQEGDRAASGNLTTHNYDVTVFNPTN